MPTPPLIPTVDGVAKPITEWSKLHGGPVNTIRSRIQSRWAAADAVRVPPDRRFRGGKTPGDTPRPCPELRRHKRTGLAFVERTGGGARNIRYLGKAGSKEAADAYARFQLEPVMNLGGPVL